MAATLQVESTLTDRYQTTLPSAVRKLLGLGKRAKIRYQVQPDGTVTLSGGGAGAQEDPVLGHFLGFLAKDMRAHPQKMRALRSAWLKRMRSLVKGVKVDLNEPLDPADE